MSVGVGNYHLCAVRHQPCSARGMYHCFQKLQYCPLAAHKKINVWEQFEHGHLQWGCRFCLIFPIDLSGGI